jgi:hypothetical protein
MMIAPNFMMAPDSAMARMGAEAANRFGEIAVIRLVVCKWQKKREYV